MITATHQTLTSPCRPWEVLFQSSEIYGGFTSICEYGPFGVKLKKALTLTKVPALRADVEKVLAQLQQ